MSETWYVVNNIEKIDSPALIVYPERARNNIRQVVSSVVDVERLRPHVKTHKSEMIVRMHLEEGISKFKCATIAEAEMLAEAGAKDILLAYQPVGPKQQRLLELSRKFSEVKFACLIDNVHTADSLSKVFHSASSTIGVFIDLNVGMNRTGLIPSEAFTLWKHISSLPGISLRGLHAYDGHIRDIDYNVRKKRSDEAFESVVALANKIRDTLNVFPEIIAGGTPTFSVHCKRDGIECSPGTYIYWDKGYEQILPEQNYLHAAVLVTRVISKPTANIICCDLGHKSVASENPLSQRIAFLNAPDLTPIGHSEEHMVFQTSEPDHYNVGDVLYGIPYHVCPTIALHERCYIAEEGSVTNEWATRSRDKKITI